MSLAASHRSYFLNLLGEQRFLTQEEEVKEWAKDWTKPESVSASCVIFPKNTEEVSQILKYCNEHSLPIIPSGGRTGLAGAAVARDGEIILSLAKMNKVLNVDTIGLTIEVEAGLTTQALQEHAASKKLLYGVDLGSRGSCQIGGNLATNAGGLKFIRYGGTREQVLGMEVVLADGRVLDLNRSLRKNNSGYNLLQLFVGSEGTLGVITKATLKLEKRPGHLRIACLSLTDFDHVMTTLELCHQDNLSLTAFEFFTVTAMNFVLNKFPSLRDPFGEKSAYYVLVELEEHEQAPVLEKFLEKLFEKGLIQDGVMSNSVEEFRTLWSLRENITESLAQSGHVCKNDISVGVKDLGAFFKKVESLTRESDKEIELVFFGHVGDGNIHVNYSAPARMNEIVFKQKAHEIEKIILGLVHRFKGSISAEHGIGWNKKEEFRNTVDPLELSYMKDLKRLFDPKNILNPGKIFDL